MLPIEGKNDRLLTGLIIILSVAGILYFGYRAVSENSKKNQENPFEYNIDHYKKSDADYHLYSEVQQIPIHLRQVYGIALDLDDNLYVTGDDSVLIFNPDGRVLSTILTGESAVCLSVDENGDLHLGMRDHVEVYDRKGVKKARWKSLGEDGLITSIAVTRENVYVADAGNHVVWQFDKSGKQKRRIGEKNEVKDIPGFVIPSPFFDVSVDPDGFLWVVNPGRHSLENYTPEGDLRTSWGKFSMEMEGFCGCCNPSHIVILEDGSFVTSEKGIARVKVYNRLGNLVSVVAGPDQFAEGTMGLDLAKDSSQRIYVLDPVKKIVRIFEKK